MRQGTSSEASVTRILARSSRRSLLHIILIMAPHQEKKAKRTDHLGTLDVINTDPSQCKEKSSTNQHHDTTIKPESHFEFG